MYNIHSKNIYKEENIDATDKNALKQLIVKIYFLAGCDSGLCKVLMRLACVQYPIGIKENTMEHI